jgi:signal peptidase II
MVEGKIEDSSQKAGEGERAGASRHSPSLRLGWFYAGAVAVLLIDQVTKILVRRALAEGEFFPVLSGIVHFQHVKNTGAAFGLFAEATGFLTFVKLAVCAFIVYSARFWVGKSRWVAVTLMLILGGALGNLVDSLLFGSVTDFIDFDTSLRFLRDWPVFNVADVALSAGTVMMVGELLLQTKMKDEG